MSTKDLYQELILDHGNSPKNRKELDSFNKDIEAFSPLCGDKNTIILADFFKKLLSGSNQSNSIILNEADKIKLNSFSSVAKFPMRAKCATLPWIAVASAITNDAKIINIENMK